MRSVHGVSYRVEAGQTVGVVGESGCGKSVTALSVMRLIQTPPGRFAGGAIRYRGTDLLKLSEAEMRRIRGNRISMIFQEPMTSLNPVLTVGRQIAETVMLHQQVGRREALARATEMLRLVQIPEPQRRVNEYPHQLSGGMRQRVMIALALACHPELLIADEPTTALDVTIQAQILELLRGLQRELGMGIVMITHDLGVVAECCDRVVVMYAGRKVEEADVLDLFERPLHPYTRALMASMPSMNTHSARLTEIPASCPRRTRRCAAAPSRRAAASRASAAATRCAAARGTRCGRVAPVGLFPCRGAGAHDRSTDGPGRVDAGGRRMSTNATTEAGTPLLEVRDLRKHYQSPGSWISRRKASKVYAVDGVSFSVAAGETLALVGESGCGKTTTGKSILRLIEPTSGTVQLNGRDLLSLDAGAMREQRREMQIIFQDPYASLNPRMTAGELVAEPLRNFGVANGAQRNERVAWLFSKVGLRPEAMKKHAARVLGRPAPAPGHRARPGAEPEADRLRRAGVGARRVGAGAGHQPADRPAGRVRHCYLFVARTTSRWCATSATAWP